MIRHIQRMLTRVASLFRRKALDRDEQNAGFVTTRTNRRSRW
jgi:hypothetical protein